MRPHARRGEGVQSLIAGWDGCAYRLRMVVNVSILMGFTRLVPLLALAVLLCGSPAAAEDWPQFLGPNRNGTYIGPALALAWPPEGPPAVWKRGVGQGFSGLAVSGGRCVLFHRMENRAVVECLDARTGVKLWEAGYPTDYRDDFGFDEGPRATPAIADGCVFTFGAEGALTCWKLASGERVWHVDTFKEFHAPKGFFGRACSPLVEGGKVLLNLGGKPGAGIVALNALTGQLLWKATEDEASYASPVLTTIQGRRYLLSLTRAAFVALNPDDGKVYFRRSWRPALQASVSAATPLVADDLVFISASYGAGASLMRFHESGPEEIWSGDQALSNHYATSVLHGGFLYGWHGRQEQGCELRCVELLTGRVRWREPGLVAGTVTLAGEHLLVLTEKGLLLRAPAAPEAFTPVCRAQVLPAGVRAYPALASGYFYARSKDQLICLDLSPRGPK